MPTFNQLVRQGRKAKAKTHKSKAPMLQTRINTLKNRTVYKLSLIHI